MNNEGKLTVEALRDLLRANATRVSIAKAKILDKQGLHVVIVC